MSLLRRYNISVIDAIRCIRMMHIINYVCFQKSFSEHIFWTFILDTFLAHVFITCFQDMFPGHVSWTLFRDTFPEHVSQTLVLDTFPAQYYCSVIICPTHSFDFNFYLIFKSLTFFCFYFFIYYFFLCITYILDVNYVHSVSGSFRLFSYLSKFKIIFRNS